MKKLLIMLIVLIACVACLSSCKLFPCKHKKTVTDTAIAPTCTESGLTEGKHCSKCGEVTVKQKTVNPIEHNIVIDESVPATCTEDGLTTGAHCSVCKERIIAQEVVPAGHTYGEWQTVSAPDCFFEGEQTRACSACDYVDTEKLAKIEHSFVENEETGINACEHCDAAMYDGRIYKLFTIILSWLDAYTYCENLGGHLVTITSAEEQAFIKTYMSESTAGTWGGAYGFEDEWQWVTGEEFEYSNWDFWQPDCAQGVEYFLDIHFQLTSKWNDAPLKSKLYLMCEWEAE